MQQPEEQKQSLKEPNIRQEIQLIKDEISKIRRHIHQYPETKYEEFETAKYIEEHLKKHSDNLEIKTGVGQTGVVAILKGKQEGPCILLRADMDALNLEEDTNEEFTSKIKGKHHACGHDGHVAMLLGAAMVISKWQEKLKGTIKFCFQPAEEGGAGALAMVEDKVYPVLENPKVDKCFGIHLYNNAEYPFIGCVKEEGVSTANSDRFHIDIQGVGTHAMCPHNGVDAVMIGCQLVQSLYTIKSRNVDPMSPQTISIGVIDGGTLPNIVSAKCNIQGTVRTLDQQDRENIKKRMTEICQGFETTYNCKVNFKYNYLYESVYNSQEAIDDVFRAGEKIFHVTDSTFGLVGEDFCFFSQRTNSAFYLIGSAPKGCVKDGGRTILRPHHSPFFTIDENSLYLGASMWLQIVEDLLVN